MGMVNSSVCGPGVNGSEGKTSGLKVSWFIVLQLTDIMNVSKLFDSPTDRKKQEDQSLTLCGRRMKAQPLVLRLNDYTACLKELSWLRLERSDGSARSYF
jgi:hypothetical protein